MQLNDTCPVDTTSALCFWEGGGVKADSHFHPAFAHVSEFFFPYFAPSTLLRSAERFLSAPHFLHSLSSLSVSQASSLAGVQLSTERSAAAPHHSQINFLLGDASSGGPQIPHPHLTYPRGPAEFFADFLAAPKMSICIVESEGQGKRLQPCRFLCLRASWLWQCLQLRLQRGSSHH